MRASPSVKARRVHRGTSRETTMTQTITQRLTIALPLVGVAFLLASLFLPVQFAAVAWTLAMISFLVALTCALLDQRGRRAERSSAR
jgi:hypothetical protein